MQRDMRVRCGHIAGGIALGKPKLDRIITLIFLLVYISELFDHTKYECNYLHIKVKNISTYIKLKMTLLS